ncbi:MAG: glycosyltransferase [Nitrospirales bacterium]
MKCRLLYLVGQLGLGGLERQLYYLLYAMDRNRFHPTVVVWNYKCEDSYARLFGELGVPLYGLPDRLFRLGKIRAFRQLVKSLSPEIVHSYSFYTNFAAWYATLGLSAIPIGSIRQNFISERKKAGKLLGCLSARWPAFNICNSVAAKNTVESMRSYWKPQFVFSVRNGLDLDQFQVFPMAMGQAKLLAIGRLFPEKRWDRLLHCLELVSKKGLKFELNLVGDGPLRKRLEMQASHLGIDDKVNFLGTRCDIPTLLQDATFLVHTADDEGCPNVVMEAMACGRAVVATDAGDVPCLVEHEKTGYLVRRGDDSTLVESISELITNFELSRRMGEAGRAKAEKEFGLNRLVSETLAVYRAAHWESF